jgi:hypothetical protein
MLRDSRPMNARRWQAFYKSFLFLLPTILVGAFVTFYFVLITGRGIVFSPNDSPIWVTGFWRGYNFREILDTPTIYLFSISFVSALVGAIWAGFMALKYPKDAHIQLIFVPWIAVILTGPVWGLIWSINHWPADGFSSYEMMMLFRKSDISSGANLSWLSAIQSYPLNIISYLLFCGILNINKRLFLDKKGDDE